MTVVTFYHRLWMGCHGAPSDHSWQALRTPFDGAQDDTLFYFGIFSLRMINYRQIVVLPCTAGLK